VLSLGLAENEVAGILCIALGNKSQETRAGPKDCGTPPKTGGEAWGGDIYSLKRSQSWTHATIGQALEFETDLVGGVVWRKP